MRQTAWAAGGAGLVTALVLGHAAWMASPAVLVEMLVGFPAGNYGDHFHKTNWAAIQPMTDTNVSYAWHPLLRMAPILPVLEVLRLGWRRPFGRAERARACLVLLAGCTTLAVIYLPDAIHVGFVLPFLLVPGLCCAHDVRTTLLAARGASSLVAGTLVVWGLAGAVVARGAANLERARSAAPVRWQSGFGALETDPAMEQAFRALTPHLITETDGRRLLYSYPNDAWLYLALPASNATRFDVMVPSQFPRQYVEEVLAALRARRPGTIVLRSFIPVDEVRRTVEAHYDLAEETGSYRIYVRRQGPP